MATERVTRHLTGLPSWGLGLVTGPEKSGKTYACAEAATSDLIGRTYWLGVGEKDPDEYGALPGTENIEVVPHDGTYRDILAALHWMNDQPRLDGKPTLYVVDSATKLWDLVTDDLQDEANARERRKAAKYHRSPKDGDMTITTDMWNLGKQRWAHVVDALKANHGPSLMTARLDIVSVMQGDSPTGEKVTKIKAEKTLPFEVDWIVEVPEPGVGILTGVKSLRIKGTPTTRTPVPDFSVDKVWRGLGMDGEVGVAHHAATAERPPEVDVLAAEADRAESLDLLREVWHLAGKWGLLDTPVDDNQSLRQRLDDRRVALTHMEEEAS